MIKKERTSLSGTESNPGRIGMRLWGVRGIWADFGFLMEQRISRASTWGLLLLLISMLLWWNCLPDPLFTDSYCTVVKSRDGELMGARIADDGQWRFPEVNELPDRYRTSVLLFEDEYFYYHPGFNPVSIVKAVWHNLTRPSRRGGSTISQQLIRLSRKNRSRTYGEKLIELLWSTRLEWRYSKNEILAMYAAHTPYGGNVVGLETASWRYFGVDPNRLSWAQTATLAVLPNAPSLIFPGRNPGALKKKRNRLLRRLHQKGHLDSLGLELALAEPVPERPRPLPDLSPHLTEWVRAQRREVPKSGDTGTPISADQQSITTLDADLQRRVNRWVESRHRDLRTRGIHNMAVLVMDVQSREVLAYVGNSPADDRHSPDVDMIRSPRSTGSVLKPLLFTAALENGQLLPESLIPDIPTSFSGYRPENFDRTYRGAVPASEALASSLNVPAVRALREYGLEKFYRSLSGIGLQPAYGPEHYGLAYILGGAELSLWELTGTYAALADRLVHYTKQRDYRSDDFREPNVFLGGSNLSLRRLPNPENSPWKAAPLYLTFEALRNVNRPGAEQQWEFFRESQPIAWKTGTSFGFKDAWAIGVTPRYAIGVWVGNADGEGRAGLTGIRAAAPLFFDILGELPQSGWFEAPDDWVQANTCAQSGWLAGPLCSDYLMQSIPKKGLRSRPCSLHEEVFLDRTGRLRVNADCYPSEDMQSLVYFQLPSTQSYYFARTRNDYQRIPPWKEGCEGMNQPVMDFIFPTAGEDVLIPVDLGGTPGDVVFSLAHQNPDTQIYWYLDETYLGTTETFHEWALSPKPGEYVLTVVDAQGNRIQRRVRFRMASE